MSAIALERPRRRYAARVRTGTTRTAELLLVLAALWGLWEGFRGLWIHEGWTWPFAVSDITIPHLHAIVQQLFEPATSGGPLLITILWHHALFTAKEALVGFAVGASVGFVLGDPVEAPRAVGASVSLLGLQSLRDRERRRRHHRRGAVVDPERPRRGDHHLQPVLLARAEEPVGDKPRRRAARDRVLPRGRRRRAAGR